MTAEIETASLDVVSEAVEVCKNKAQKDIFDAVGRSIKCGCPHCEADAINLEKFWGDGGKPKLEFDPEKDATFYLDRFAQALGKLDGLDIYRKYGTPVVEYKGLPVRNTGQMKGLRAGILFSARSDMHLLIEMGEGQAVKTALKTNEKFRQEQGL